VLSLQGRMDAILVGSEALSKQESWRLERGR